MFQTQYIFRDVKETFDLLFPQKVDLFCSFIFLKAVLRRILKSNIYIFYMVLFSEIDRLGKRAKELITSDEKILVDG